MDYYYLKLSELVKNPIVVNYQDLLIVKKSFEEFEDLSIFFFHYEKGVTETPDILTSPVFLVSKTVRDLFGLYDTTMRFKGIQLFSEEEKEKQCPLYFLPEIKKVDCLYHKVVIFPNGTIDKIILDKNKLDDTPVFMLDRIIEQKVMINEDVAESLLRRNLYGIGLERVEVV